MFLSIPGSGEEFLYKNLHNRYGRHGEEELKIPPENRQPVSRYRQDGLALAMILRISLWLSPRISSIKALLTGGVS